MVLIGYLAFLDPPKPSAAEAIEQLYAHGVAVKILSGDNDVVVKAIARQVGIDTSHFLTGIEIENMDETALKKAVKDTTLFSKLTPLQKTQIISLLQEQGNTVGSWEMELMMQVHCVSRTLVYQSILLWI